jgi:hypothetical protein
MLNPGGQAGIESRSNLPRRRLYPQIDRSQMTPI